MVDLYYCRTCHRIRRKMWEVKTAMLGDAPEDLTVSQVCVYCIQPVIPLEDILLDMIEEHLNGKGDMSK